MGYHDHNHDEIESVSSYEFVQKAKVEISTILERGDPVWTKKFKNFIDLSEGLAFRSGFLFGAITSAMIALVLLWITK